MFVSTYSFSAEISQDLFKYNSSRTFESKEALKNTVSDGVILNINNEVYTSIFEKRDLSLNLRIPLSDNRFALAELERFDILSPDAKITERSSSGESIVNLNNIILSYKGYISGIENSLVSISFYDNKIVGLMKTGNETFVLGELNDENGVKSGDYILYEQSKLKVKNHLRCGSEIFDVPDEIKKRIKDINAKPLDLGIETMLFAKIAIDVDFYTYNLYGGSVPNASAYALSLMSAASAIYCKDMNIRLFVSYLRVWTTQDPYTSNSGDQLLNQFRAEWIATQGGVDRVVAHLISRRNSIDVGGIAYLNVLCNTSFGYGLSSVNGTINQLPAYSYDVVVVAHELGHNFGSEHTHSCSWVGGPIDTCYFTEGGCYSGPLHPTEGTIMSYCDTEGGTVIMDFGTQPEALIRTVAEGAGCVTASSTSLFLAYPNGGETFRSGTSTRVFWGSSLAGNINIEYSSNNGSSWNIIQNNVSAQLREYVWTVPAIAYTNQAKVRIINSSNPAEGDTSDAGFRLILTYNPISDLLPPANTTIETSPSGTEINKFIWSSAGTHPSFRYKYKIRKLGTAVDYIYTADAGGADTAISIRNSFLDSLALTFGTTGDSVRCTWRGWAYNGYDSIQSSNVFVVVLKRTGVGINLLSSTIPESFKLENNYPNPFNPTTMIKFDVSKFMNVKISIYDILGKELEVLVNEKLQPGKYDVSFSGDNYSSGVYYYKMETSDFVSTKKMLLIK